MVVVGNVWHSALEGIEHASLSKHHCPVLLADKGSQCPDNGQGGGWGSPLPEACLRLVPQCPIILPSEAAQGSRPKGQVATLSFS